MVENLSFKIDSLSDENPDNLDTGASEILFENTASTSRNCEAESLIQSEGHHSKHQLMKNKRNIKNTNIFVNDDLTALRVTLTRDLRRRDDLCLQLTKKSFYS